MGGDSFATSTGRDVIHAEDRRSERRRIACGPDEDYLFLDRADLGLGQGCETRAVVYGEGPAR